MRFWLWFACGGAPAAPATAVVTASEAPPCHDELPAGAASEGSMYDLTIDLERADGTRAALDAQRGHPVIVAMFYAGCAQACPMTIAKIQGIEGRLSEEARRDLRVVMVSLDPAHDTPEALTELKGEHALDERWTLARAPEDQVRELSAALGVKYRRLADGEINHSTVLTLLDAQGVPRSRVDSLGASDDALVAALDRLLAP